MLSFISSEARQRARAFNSYIEPLEVRLHNGAVQSALGKEAIRRHLETLDRLVLCNMHNDIASVPKRKTDEDSVPVVIMPKGVNRVKCNKTVTGKRDPSNEYDIETLEDTECGKTVAHRYISQLTSGIGYWALPGKPYMMLRDLQDEDDDYRSLVLLHEDRHVVQLSGHNCYASEKHRFRRAEIEAYHEGAIYYEALGKTLHDGRHVVELTRRKHYPVGDFVVGRCYGKLSHPGLPNHDDTCCRETP